jgi:hypothetical protein
MHAEDLPIEPLLEREIRLRAYDLYVRRGRRNGHALDDWLEAEREVLRELESRGFTPPSINEAG